MPDDVKPFLSVVATTAPRGFASAIPSIAVEPAPSPWTPRATAPAAPATAPAIDVDAVRAEARASGRAEGLRETESLRGKLSALLVELDTARKAFAAPSAELAADIATCVIETWIGGADRRTLFEPAIKAWLERTTEAGATVRVHPDDVAAATAAIGEAPLTVVADHAAKPGELHIRGTAAELHHSLTARLGELRVAIAAAIEASR